MYNVIILGIIISIIFYELTEISPGGIIVPGYITLFITQPQRIVLTIALSLITLWIVNILSNYTILYGRRRFGMMVIISFLIRLIVQKSIYYLPVLDIFTASSIGYIIPGIIAQDIGRQGMVKTISSMILVASLIKLIDIVVNGVLI
jgi:poly-gamma-glutamate biosynthesis protein PgsC/CapC